MITILFDTNLLINEPDYSLLPVAQDQILACTSSLCYAEFQEGEFTTDPVAAASFMLQSEDTIRAFGEGIPFGRKELAAYRAVCAAVVATGRQLTRGRRIDLMIAATALANGMTLATRNTEDFAGLERVVPVIAL